MYVLGYDIGSSSVKASLVNVESGKCAASAFFPKTEAPILAVKQGWAEQDPQSWWDNLKLATQAVLTASGAWTRTSRCSVPLLYGVTPELYHTVRKHFRHWEKRSACHIC